MTRTLVSSQGRRPQPSSFSYVPRSLPCGSGRHAASRTTSARDGPGVGSSPLAWVCPTAIPPRPRHLHRLAPEKRSDDRRARASGPSEGRVTSPRTASGRSWWLRALGAHRRRSPPRRPESIRCRRRDRSQGMRPSRPSRTDQDSRSCVTPRRVPPSGESGCLPPPRRQAPQGSLPTVSCVGLPLTPPTRSPFWGGVLSRGIASVRHRANPETDFERADTFSTRW